MRDFRYELLNQFAVVSCLKKLRKDVWRPMSISLPRRAEMRDRAYADFAEPSRSRPPPTTASVHRRRAPPSALSIPH